MLITSGNTMSSALSMGLEAYQRASNSLQDASSNLLHQQARGANINHSAVTLVSAPIAAEAGANVIKRADDMLGTIIDTYA